MAVDLSRLGAFASDPTDTGVPVEFRFSYQLPDGFAVDVLIIHYEDRFVECVPPNVYPLARGNDGIRTANFTYPGGKNAFRTQRPIPVSLPAPAGR